jgi:hypothetical protein
MNNNRKQKIFKMKISKRKAMKTRIFTTVAMLILTTNLIAGTVNKSEKDSVTVLAYATINNNLSEIIAGNFLFTSNLHVAGTADILEEWIASRESWEQEDSGAETGNTLREAVNMEEWISEREAWEKAGEASKTELIETVSLEEWITSRESWEQEGSKTEVTGTSVESSMLKVWVMERENWEQK